MLRLPFIVHTSLPHEIAHSWWGNGVLVDYRQGNWCEGLTTYVSDYYLKERRSAADARRYRMQMLRDYTTLVPPSRDFPLSQFTSRVDPVSRAIGYDKGAMVFHMLRRMMGDGAFWQALRDIAGQRMFRATTWSGLREIFQRHTRTDLRPFFGQWIFRGGAPLLSLEKPAAVPTDGSWRITAAVTQAAPTYALDVAAVFQSADGRRVRRVHLAGPRTAFAFSGTGAPRRLAIDPDFEVMRRLHAAELPPVINSLKSAARVSLVLAQTAGKGPQSAARILAEGLGLKDVRVVSMDRPVPGRLPDTDLIVVGHPRELGGLPARDVPLALKNGTFEVEGVSYDENRQGFFAVLPHPRARGRVMALFCPPPAPAGLAAARKITHYGRYSYLVFNGSRVERRGTWPVPASPLIYRWPPQKTGG